jgi:hypothetical protein
MLKMFEGTIVVYMINQARMPFAQIVNYPLYKIENNSLVVDDSEYTKNLKDECKKISHLLAKMCERVKNDAPIPKVWKTRIIEQEPLIIALKQGGNICDEWFNEFNRLLRYVKEQ